jgi:hypothetical protein
MATEQGGLRETEGLEPGTVLKLPPRQRPTLQLGDPARRSGRVQLGQQALPQGPGARSQLPWHWAPPGGQAYVDLVPAGELNGPPRQAASVVEQHHERRPQA